MKTILFEEVPKRSCGAGIIETILHTEKETQLHNHDFCEFFIIKKGTLLHKKNYETRLLKRGDYCLIEASDLHCFQKKSKNKVAFVNISFPQSFLEEIVEQSNIKEKDKEFVSNGSLNPTQMAVVDDVLLLLMSVGVSPKNPLQEQTILKSLLQMLLLSKVLSMPQIQNEAPAWLEQAICALHEPENLQKGLRGFVDRCGYTQEHITRQVRKYYQQTPSQMINKLRVDYAQKLLTSTELPILEISMKLGYESVSYFNRVFMREAGMSPRAYRNRVRMAIY